MSGWGPDDGHDVKRMGVGKCCAINECSLLVSDQNQEIMGDVLQARETIA